MRVEVRLKVRVRGRGSGHATRLGAGAAALRFLALPPEAEGLFHSPSASAFTAAAPPASLAFLARATTAPTRTKPIRS